MTEREYRDFVLHQMLGDDDDVRHDAAVRVAVARGWVLPGEHELRSLPEPLDQVGYQTRLRETWLQMQHEERN